MHQLAQAVARILLDQPYYRKAQNVACYLSMANGELRTKAIVKDLLASGESESALLRPNVLRTLGRRLYTPYLPPPSAPAAGPSHDQTGPPKAEMRMLRLYSEDDLARCPLDKWGILDPGTHRREEGLENESRENGKLHFAFVLEPEAKKIVLDEGAPQLDLILLPGVAFDIKSNRVSTPPEKTGRG
jgi:5-formyltetrahydrofolate cyclo-ligase